MSLYIFNVVIQSAHAATHHLAREQIVHADIESAAFHPQSCLQEGSQEPMTRYSTIADVPKHEPDEIPYVRE